MKTRIITWLLLALFVLAGCGEKTRQKGPELFTAAVWNVQNLFDGQDNGNEYSEFGEAGGWTREKYAARITAISQALAGISAGSAGPGLGAGSSSWAGQRSAAGLSSGTGLPDLIGLTEIENLAVLEDLARALSKHGYYWAAFANVPGASIGLGAISRYPITDIRAHSITIEGQTAPRPVLEIRIEPESPGSPRDLTPNFSRDSPQSSALVFLLCHWKSKTGGEEATTALRRASARVVQRRLREIKAEGGPPLIVLGDLNENHDEFYRRGTFSALLPDDPEAAALAALAGQGPSGVGPEKFVTGEQGLSGFIPGRQGPGRFITGEQGPSIEGRNFTVQDFLVLSGERPPRARYFPEGTLALYSPWFGESLDGAAGVGADGGPNGGPRNGSEDGPRSSPPGSYYFRDNWETIDHFLLCEDLFTGAGWEYSGSAVLNRSPFTNSRGSPNSYNPRSGLGLSDHLPLLLFLEFVN